ncbi:potassium uptake protein, TrkH family [Oscillospiraceae bacterium OttesenSCG-928-G22]|nr:potassium uptake protein, TrkH family [Oscillospiraceae bacterium OttesenSCG-928-G22]
MNGSNISKRRAGASPARFVMKSFLVVIAAGTGLLMLPGAAREAPASFMTALFASVSATCVTGLQMHDTFTYWAPFGQAVHLLLVQLGGLGVMTLASLMSFFLRRTIGLKERLIMVQSLNLQDIKGVVRTVRHVLVGTLVFEGAGTVIFTLCFLPRFGFPGALVKGMFHAVSSFCNAGFDILGDTASGSVSAYATHPVFSVTTMVLVIVGGLGFFVWEDIYTKRSFKKLHLHSKIVLLSSGILIFAGAALFFAFEYDNPGTIGGMSLSGKVLSSAFQSVSSRTAGFSGVSQLRLTDASKLLTIFLMSVGGSPGSAAGGLKTTTVVVLLVAGFSIWRGRTDVTLAGRTFPKGLILNALSLFIFALLLFFCGTFLITLFEPDGTPYIPFEVLAALSTVGFPHNLTPTLSLPSQVVLMVLMFCGRAGVMSLNITALTNQFKKQSIRYPEVKILIG